jgi:aconitate hydratase
MFLGVKVVLAKSIERIHMANLVNFGILPATFESQADYDKIAQGDDLQLAQVRRVLESGEARMVLRDVTRGVDIPLSLLLTARQRAIVLAGGLLNFTKEGKT